MPKINQLSAHVADLIAAGEVVERPGSVVKELLENAIDAGATHITVEIQNGGMTFIRLTDNGCGMAPEDAKIAFLRHATSKIQTESDLAEIQTLGFRGEALAAIASVSRIDLLTRSAEAESGISLHLEAGKITASSEAGCPTGTTIIVRDLFYNTPARMKFMKSDSAEASFIFAAVQKQAMAHPELSIRFLKDGQELLQTAGDGELHSAIYQIWGRELASGLVPVQSKWEQIAVSGYVSKPTLTRGNRNYQIFFVNGRYIKSKLLSAALEDAYQNQIMTGRMPACVLNLTMPLHMVDVNVHPAKTEVRFLSPREVSDCVRYGVLAALNRTPGRVAMRLPSDAQDSTPAAKPAPVASTPVAFPSIPAAATRPAPATPAAKVKTSSTQSSFFQTMTPQEYRTFTAGMQTQPAKPAPEVLKKAEALAASAALHETVIRPAAAVASAKTATKPAQAPAEKAQPATTTTTQPPQPAQPEPQQELSLPEASPYRVVGEVLDTYIIVEQDQTVLFIDKHAAHERIIFERLKKNPQQMMGQRLLAPLICTPDQEEAAILLANRALLLELGYEIDEFGAGTLAVRQIPADVAEADALACLSELAQRLAEHRSTDTLHDALLHTIACKAAIKAGWHTQPQERDALVRQVMSREDLKYCPHGRPICITLSKRQLEHQFKRA